MQAKYKLIVTLALLLNLAVLLAACGNEATPAPLPTATAVPSPTLAPSPTPFTAASYSGTWQGVVVQPSVGSFPIIMVLTDLKFDGIVGAMDYPTQKCSFSLRMTDTQKGKYVLKEKLEHNEPGAGCTDNGSANIRLTPEGTMSWEWFYADGKPGAYGTLARRNDYPFLPTRNPYSY